MAEKHPPSPELKEKSIAQEIAGQARNDGIRLRFVFPGFIVFKRISII